MTEVSKGELAKHIGVSPGMITKHVKAGTLDMCFTRNGKKIYLEKAIEAIELSRKRDSRVSKLQVPQAIRNDDSIYNEDAEQELLTLMELAQSPSQKVQIIKDFWAGKINRQKFLENEGELISVQDAKAAVEMILSPLNQYLDSLPVNIKNHFPDVSVDVVEWLSEENNRQKEQLRIKNWEN